MGVCLSCKNFDDLKVFDYRGPVRMKVVDVYDGDTITVVFYDHGYRKFKLRIAGFDTPEIKPLKTIPYREKHIACAIIAREFVKKSILGRTITVNLIGYEKYGRLLGEIPNLKEILIAKGLAKPYDGKGKTEFTEFDLNRILTIHPSEL